MSRTPWQFDGYDFPTNPDDDSGWTTEVIYSEKNGINATGSRLQFGALKSPRRQISGYFFGLKAVEQHDKFQTWLTNRTQATLVDHMGISRRAVLVKFDAKVLPDVRAYKDGRATFRFTAEFFAL